MDIIKIILENGAEQQVNGIFYLYNSKYYFMYTEGEIDQNGYVVLHVVKVAKEMKNTPDGPVDTGCMVGVEITDENEWHHVQKSISEIVEDKKTSTTSSSVQYLPISMITTLKIISKKTFRLMRDIIENSFNVKIESDNSKNEDSSINNLEANNGSIFKPNSNDENNESDPGVIIDYRTRFFEEQEKNKELQGVIDNLNSKLDEIKKIIG